MGDKTKSCLPDGIWSGDNSTCQPVECASVPLLPNGRVNVKSPYFGGKTEYACDPGYKLKGARKRVCRADKTWSEKEPECQLIICPDPPIVQNGFSVSHKEVNACESSVNLY